MWRGFCFDAAGGPGRMLGEDRHGTQDRSPHRALTGDRTGVWPGTRPRQIASQDRRSGAIPQGRRQVGR